MQLSELPLEPAPRSRLSLGTGAAVLLVLATLAVAVLVTMLQPQGGEHLGAATASAAEAEAGIDAERPAGGQGSAMGQGEARGILVHVLGAVASPGVYSLNEGARVVDAVAAAGGFADDADQAVLNLVQTIGDGEQLRVPRRGEAARSPGAGSAAGTADTASGGAGGKVDLNTADAAALQTLPRIGPALAQRILDWRSQHGRFSSIDELMDVAGIGRKTFEGLRSRITI